MDRYNCKWVMAFAPNNASDNAITLGQTTYYSESEEYVKSRPLWQAHENKHKEQWKKEGRFKFAIKYLWYQLTKGYERNPYEIEARLAEGIMKASN